MKANASVPTAQATPPDPLSIGPIVDVRFEALKDWFSEVIASRPPEPLLDSAGLAQKLAVTPQTIAKLRGQGLPFIRVGEVFRYEWSLVREWLTSRGDR